MEIKLKQIDKYIIKKFLSTYFMAIVLVITSYSIHYTKLYEPDNRYIDSQGYLRPNAAPFALHRSSTFQQEEGAGKECGNGNGRDGIAGIGPGRG